MSVNSELLKLAAEIDNVESLRLAAAKPKGPGWSPSPGGKHGAMRRKKSGGGFEYWYPSAGHAAKAAVEHEEEANSHAEESGKSYTKALQSGGAAQHHKDQADHHAKRRDEYGYGNAERRKNSETHDKWHHESLDSHKGHKTDENKHTADHKEHSSKSREHTDHATEASRFVKENTKKPGLWDKMKGLFGGGSKKKDEPKKDVPKKGT